MIQRIMNATPSQIDSQPMLVLGHPRMRVINDWWDVVALPGTPESFFILCLLNENNGKRACAIPRQIFLRTSPMITPYAYNWMKNPQSSHSKKKPSLILLLNWTKMTTVICSYVCYSQIGEIWEMSGPMESSSLLFQPDSFLKEVDIGFHKCYYCLPTIPEAKWLVTGRSRKWRGGIPIKLKLLLNNLRSRLNNMSFLGTLFLRILCI